MSMIEQLAQDAGGKINEVVILDDGSGFATMEFPLPADHWLTAPNADGVICEPPPMTMHMGTSNPERKAMEDRIRRAAQYALRASTMNGAEDFDPDAVIQNLIVGMLGYYTASGLSEEGWANPPHLRPATD